VNHPDLHTTPQLAPTPAAILNQCLALTATASLLWLFHLYARVLDTAFLVGICLLVTVLLLMALWWRARLQRQVLLLAHVQPGSPLQRWMRGGLLMALLRLPLAMVLAPLLLVTLVRLDDNRLWLLLIVAAPVLVLLRTFLRARLAFHAREPYLTLLLWRIGSATLFLVLLAVVIALSIARDWPDFQAATLEQAIWHMADREVARSAPFQDLLQLFAAMDGLRLWLAQQVLPALPLDRLLLLVGWALVFAKNALFVWSYALILHAVLVLTAPHGRQIEHRY